jgi:hypothetical protein
MPDPRAAGMASGGQRRCFRSRESAPRKMRVRRAGRDELIRTPTRESERDEQSVEKVSPAPDPNPLACSGSPSIIIRLRVFFQLAEPGIRKRGNSG